MKFAIGILAAIFFSSQLSAEVSCKFLLVGNFQNPEFKIDEDDIISLTDTKELKLKSEQFIAANQARENLERFMSVNLAQHPVDIGFSLFYEANVDAAVANDIPYLKIELGHAKRSSKGVFSKTPLLAKDRLTVQNASDYYSRSSTLLALVPGAKVSLQLAGAYEGISKIQLTCSFP